MNTFVKEIDLKSIGVRSYAIGVNFERRQISRADSSSSMSANSVDKSLRAIVGIEVSRRYQSNFF